MSVAAGIALLLALAAPASAVGAAVPAAAAPERAQVTARLAEVEGDPGLSAPDRERVTGQYRRVLGHLDALAEAEGALAGLREEQAAAPAQTAAIRARQGAASASPETPVDLAAGADLAAVQELLAQETAALGAYRDRLAALEQALTEGADALPRWRRELAEHRQRVADLDAERAGVAAAASLAADGTDAPEARARCWLLASERERLGAETRLLELKLAGADARRALTQAHLDEARLAADRALARQTWLQAEQERRRRDQTERVLAATEAAKEAAVDAQPQVRELARANALLAEAIGEVDRRTAQVEAARAEIAASTTALAQDFANDRQRIGAAGLNRALGRILIDRRERLPDLRELRRQAAERANAQAEATLDQLHWREELLALTAASETRPVADPAQSAPSAQLAQNEASRAALLGLAIAAEDRHLRALAELDLAADALYAVARDYRAFLAEHLLWMRSHVPVTQQSFAVLPRVLGELFRPANWRAVGQALGKGLADAWTWWGGLIAVALLFAFDRALRRRIRATAEPLRRVRTDRFAFTLQAILWTLLLAAPAPLLLALLGWVLTGTPRSEPFPYLVGEALLRIAPGLYYLRALRVMCLAGGVAELHFRWRRDTVRGLARYLDAAIWTLMPLGFVAAVVNPMGEVQASTLGRLALTGATLGFALLLAGALHPRRGLVREALAAAPDGLANRLRHLWYPLAVAVPLALAVLTLAGYQYTAGTLFHLWLGQFWLLLGLLVLQQSIVRWLLVTRRQLALRQVMERRARREAERQEAAESGEGGAQSTADAQTAADAEEDALDLVALDGQTRQLVNALLAVGGAVGLWALWSEVLPALNVLERITLWSVGTTVDGVTRALPITLADLASILVIVAVAVIAVRYLPALLEILLFKNTGISAGGRYTVIALTSYVITAVAVLLVAGRLGFAWQQVQWLVAALGVGIGFGLQEIVANFISGLIILFERPVRVGDTVTIGEHTGVVSRIEIRATTIRTLDQRELLVPNKQLITGEVINWTLSDQINRGEILVSIEYGADIETALRILNEVAAADPRVMTDPAPVITANDFGERGLDLLLRYCLPAVANRFKIRGELIQAIDARLRAAGIPIALPRRDIRLRDRDSDAARGASAALAPAASTGLGREPPDRLPVT